mgnify:CR=1 FL=1
MGKVIQFGQLQGALQCNKLNRFVKAYDIQGTFKLEINHRSRTLTQDECLELFDIYIKGQLQGAEMSFRDETLIDVYKDCLSDFNRIMMEMARASQSLNE